MIKYHLDYGNAKELICNIPLWEGMMPYYLSDFVIIDLDPDHSKGTHKVPNLYFFSNKFTGCTTSENFFFVLETTQRREKIIAAHSLS